MSGIFAIMGNYSETANEEIKDMVAHVSGSGPARSQFYCDKNFLLSAVEHGQAKSAYYYRDPLDRYTVMLFGNIVSTEAIKSKLQKEGIRAEEDLMAVILQAYKIFPANFVDMLRGSFSLVIADHFEKSVYLARDHFGSRPLYYTDPMRNGVCFVGTDIQALSRHPDFIKEFNPTPLSYFLSLQYNPCEESFWRHVYTLPPAHWAIIQKSDNGTKIRKERYFTPKFTPDNRSMSEHAEEILLKARESVKLYSKNKNAAAYLSSGVDSSFVTVLAQPKNVYSLAFEGYDGQFNESDRAEELAEYEGIRAHTRFITGREYIDTILEAQKHLNEPNGNLSTVALALLGEFVQAEDGYVLTGDGADEFFAGYDDYCPPSKLRNSYSKFPVLIKRLLAKAAGSDVPRFSLRDTLIKSSLPSSAYYLGPGMVMRPGFTNEVLKEDVQAEQNLMDFLAPFYEKIADEDELTQKMLFDIYFTLPGDMNVKAERMSNANNIELLTPLLDKEVFFTAQSIKSTMRVSREEGKLPLRKAAEQVMPYKFAHHKKLGIPVPFRDYLADKKIAAGIYDILLDPSTDKFFHRSMIERFIKEHLRKKRLRHRELYVILTFLIWYGENFA